MKNNFLFMLIAIGLLSGCSNESDAASFDCDKAQTEVEKLICKNHELSELDEDLSVSYSTAYKSYKKPNKLKIEQRQWLELRNRCQDADCLIKVYAERLTALNNIGKKDYDPNDWIQKRKKAIKNVLKDKELYIHPKTPTNSPFCHQLMQDVKNLDGIEIIAPKVIANSLDASEVKDIIFNQCPKIYNKNSAGRLDSPRKVILYHVDIDNNLDDGTEWVLGDHYILPIMPPWGKELLVYNTYVYFDINKCKQFSGSASVGGSQRYGYKTKLTKINLDTGIHGVLKYKNKFYIYDVIDEEKVDPFGIREFFPSKNKTKSICVFKERRQ